jgi:hypothetical protein
MNTLLAIGAALLGLLPFVVSPTRTFARGGIWKYVGAALIVIAAMSLFWDVRDIGAPAEDGDAAATTELSAADVKALERLFGDEDSGQN